MKHKFIWYRLKVDFYIFKIILLIYSNYIILISGIFRVITTKK